jgi:hypothetical protein
VPLAKEALAGALHSADHRRPDVAEVSSTHQDGTLLTRFLHLGVNAFQALRRCVWFVSRPQTIGVHGIPLTPEGKVVLVTLSYAKGWRLPGGGRKGDEEPREALSGSSARRSG